MSTRGLGKKPQERSAITIEQTIFFFLTCDKAFDPYTHLLHNHNGWMRVTTRNVFVSHPKRPSLYAQFTKHTQFGYLCFGNCIVNNNFRYLLENAGMALVFFSHRACIAHIVGYITCVWKDWPQSVLSSPRSRRYCPKSRRIERTASDSFAAPPTSFATIGRICVPSCVAEGALALGGM